MLHYSTVTTPHHFFSFPSVESVYNMAQDEVTSSFTKALFQSSFRNSGCKKRSFEELGISSVKKPCLHYVDDYPKAYNSLLSRGDLLFHSTNWQDVLSSAPSTPIQAESEIESSSPGSRLEALPLRILGTICKLLPLADLCRISQVNKYCSELFSMDEFWMWRAQERGIVKAVEGNAWKWNIMAAQCRLLHARKLGASKLHFSGDLAVVDPYEIFFIGNGNQIRRQMLESLLERYGSTDCVVTYRGIQSAFITSKYWDDDLAFEISRKSSGCSLGADISKSGIIAAIPLKLVKVLLEENNQSELQNGVIVEGVNGEFRSSSDGDFVIRSTEKTVSVSKRRLSHWVGFEEVECADIVCAAGGSWTFSDDSSDDEDEDVMNMTEEELSKALSDSSDWEDWLEIEERKRKTILTNVTEMCR